MNIFSKKSIILKLFVFFALFIGLEYLILTKVVFNGSEFSNWNGAVRLFIWEQFDYTDNRYKVYLKVYPVANMRGGQCIELEKKQAGNTIDIIINKSKNCNLYIPNINEDKDIPIRGVVDFDLLSGQEYTLKLHSKPKIDKYIALADDKRIIINKKRGVRKFFSTLTDNEIIRIPQNALEAECYFSGDWKMNPWDNSCQLFFDEIAKIAETYIRPEPNKKPKNMIYIFDGDKERLRDIIEKYRNTGYTLRFNLYDGTTFGSDHDNIDGYPIKSPIKIKYIDWPRKNIIECGDKPKGGNRKKESYYGCIMRTALYNNNINACELLPDAHSGSPYSKNECINGILSRITVAAAKPLDINDCGSISSVKIKNKCYWYLATYNQDANACKLITEDSAGQNGSYYNRSSCEANTADRIWQNSIEPYDLLKCDTIDDPQRADACYMSAANEIYDPNICAIIKDSRIQKDCIVDKAVKAKDISICNMVTSHEDFDWRGTCVSEYFNKSQQKTADCSKIELTDYRERALARDRCYYNTGPYASDPGYCDNIQYVPFKNKCYYNFAMKKKRH